MTELRLEWTPAHGRDLGQERVGRALAAALAHLHGGEPGAPELVKEDDLGWGDMLMAATTAWRREWRVPVGGLQATWTIEPVMESSRGISSERHAFHAHLPGPAGFSGQAYSSVTHPGWLLLRVAPDLDPPAAEALRDVLRRELGL